MCSLRVCTCGQRTDTGRLCARVLCALASGTLARGAYGPNPSYPPFYRPAQPASYGPPPRYTSPPPYYRYGSVALKATAVRL